MKKFEVNPRVHTLQDVLEGLGMTTKPGVGYTKFITKSDGELLVDEALTSQETWNMLRAMGYITVLVN